MRLGADVSQLEQLAARFAAASDLAERTRVDVDAAVRSTWWTGPRADEFRGRWARSDAPTLAMIAQALRVQADVVRRNAAEQRAASDDTLGLPGGAGGPGPSPGGPGVPGVPPGVDPRGPDPARAPAADPVDTFTGALWRVDRDAGLTAPHAGLLATPGPHTDVALDRWYHSQRRAAGWFGHGWHSLLDAHVRLSGDHAVVVDVDGTTWTFTRGEDGWLPDAGVPASLVADDDGLVVLCDDLRLLEFDDAGRLIGWTHLAAARLDAPAVPSGSVLGSDGRLRRALWVDRDADGAPVRTVSASGHEVRVDVEDGHVVAVEDPTGRHTYAYEDGRLVAVRHPGRQASYGHDAAGRLTTVHRDDQLLVSSTYDELGRVVAQDDVDGGHWRFAYEPGTTRVTRPDLLVETYAYDDAGRLVASDRPEGEATHAWSDARTLAATTIGTATVRREVAAGRVVDRLDDGPTLGEVVVEDGRVALHDGTGLDVQVEAREGGAALVGRGRSGAVDVAVQRDGATTTVRSPAMTVRLTEDAAGRLESMVGDAGRLDVTWGDDGVAAAVTQTAVAGLVTTTHVVRSEDPDAAGEVVVERRRGGHVLVREGLDHGLRPVWRERTTGRWTWAHDAAGRVVRATAPGGREATWEHGPHGPTRRSGPDGVLTLGWSPTGRLLSARTPEGRAVRFEHDDHGAVVVVDAGAGAVRLDRDARGLARAMTGPGLDVRWDVDGAGRVVGIDDAAGHVRLDHDAAGRVTALHREDGPTLGYRRDDAGRPVALTVDELAQDLPPATWASTARLAGPGGDVVGDLADDGRRVHLPDGTVVHEQDDPRGWVGRRAIRGPAGPLLDERITRDDGQLLTSWKVEVAGRRADVQLGRDAHGWVTQARVGDHHLAYRYDEAGRRTGWTDAAGEHVVELDERGRAIAVTSPTGRRELVHDAAGRLVDDGRWQYEHDAAGRLVRARQGETEIHHRLDAAGRRARSTTTVAGAVVADLWWLWDVSGRVPRVAGVVDRVHGRRELVRWGPDGVPVAIVDPDDPSRTRWLVTDHLGSVRAVVDAAGSVVRRRTFGPFGEVLEDDGHEGGLLHLGWMGAVEDVRTGQVHLQARQYDPTLGRFDGPDPVQAPVGHVPVDGYTYAANQPTELADPTGAWPGWVEKAGSAVGDAVETVADGAMHVGGVVNDAIDHVPVVNEVVDWVGAHSSEIAMGAAIIGTGAAIVVTGGAAAGVLVPAWVGTAGTAAAVTGGAIAAQGAVAHASEREWGHAALDSAGVALSFTGMGAADDVLAPFHRAAPVLTRETMRGALASSDDVANLFLDTWAKNMFLGVPLAAVDYAVRPSPQP